MMFRLMFTFVFFYNFNKIDTNNIASYDINVPLVDETGFKIELQFNDTDYDMINENEIKKSDIKLPDERFKEFNEMAKAEYQKSKFHHELNMQLSQAKANSRKLQALNFTIGTFPTDEIGKVFIHSIHKRNANNDDDDEENNDTSIIDQNEIDSSNDTVLTLEFLGEKIKEWWNEISILDLSYNCTEEDLRGMGIKAIKCILIEFGKKQRSLRFLIENLMEIITIWLVIYFIFALPLWCTKGWCSCCLCCKFFKPQQTILEAKNYLLLNPPGTLVTKKGGIIHYEPTERERDCYEEFGHFIRTL